MKLLNTMLVLTISAIFMVSSVFAGVENQSSADKVSPLIDVQSVHNAKKNASYDPQGQKTSSIVSEVHPEYVPGLRTTDVTITCGGGSYPSEVSWDISDADGNNVAAGGSPFDGAASLDDGVYTVNGYDSYGDGWNNDYLIVTDANTGTQYLNFTFTTGTYATTTFEISSAAVYGCTDPAALNYNFNCAGDLVDATNDDGCCEYPTPANDDCADAEPVTEYPATISSSSYNAQIDCAGFLNWNAVWYELALPYDYNLININIQADAPIVNGGIVVMDDCNCDDYIPMSFNWDGSIGWIQLYNPVGISGPDNNGTILYPLFIDPPQGYTVTFDVSEEIWGCTDPNANNYNPDATNDDGSCTYDPCTTTWDLLMFMYDSYGDGWNGNIYSITDFSTGQLLYSGTLETGTEAVSTPICLEDGNYGMSVDGGSFQSEVSWELNNSDGSGTVLAGGAPYSGSFTLGESDDILGCMDPTACNYDPDATIDNGSCVYEGDDCTCAYDGGSVVNGDPITGATTEALDADWYSFVVDQDYDNLTLALCGSDYDTKLDVWSGDCGEQLAYNDDGLCDGVYTLQSVIDMPFISAGTYYAKVYGFGNGFGNYVLSITAFANPTGPALTATGIPGAVALEWESVPTPDRASTSGLTTILDSPFRAEKYESLDPVISMTNPEYEPGLRTTDVSISCDGGAWQSEVSWDISNAAGDLIASGGAPYYGDASLDDGVYTVNGVDAYGDGWNGNYLIVADVNTGTNYLNWTVEGTGGTTTFEISSAAVYGCTDPEALNYNYNCAGDAVDASLDDGCCEYPTPENDECADATVVTGPYPVDITSSSYNAQIDCEGMLNWNAVWYELELPYGANNVDIFVQAEGAITNAGIILTSDCSCDPASFIYSAGFEWDPAGGWLHVWYEGVVGPDNGGTILHPLFVDAPQGYTVTYNVTELYLPQFNIYRDGAEIASAMYGNGYVDSDVTEGTEYCYTCEQIMPDGSLSDMSNTACASPDAGVGGGDTIEDPIFIDALPYSAFASTEWFTNMYDEACPYTGSASPDVVYSYTSPGDENVTIDLCGEESWYDTKVYVYENAAGALVGCNDDACNNSHQSFLSSLSDEMGTGTVPMIGGNTYYIIVDGYGGQMGQYELHITTDGASGCADDGFEDDDTKDQATDHGGNGIWDYALCAEDNPDGIVQPGGFTAIDWSMVTVPAWSNLTASTVGDPAGTSDIDIFVEDYDGDGICAWGGGDDLAGSGNAFTEEEAVFSNLSDNGITVYVGAIYFSGDSPINYSLSIEVEGLDCPECPQDLTATSELESIDLAWSPPYVLPGGGRAGDADFVQSAVSSKFERDVPRSKKALQLTKDELKVSGLHPYVHGNPEAVEAYNGEMKFQMMQESGRTSEASSFKELEEMLSAARDHDFVPGVRGDVIIYMYDAYGDGWNGNMLTIGEHIFTIETGSYAEATLTLDDGTYPVTCGGGSWMSEVSWQIIDAADGAELLVGGAPFEGELVIGGGPPPGCQDTDVTIACDGGAWQSEVSWQITDSDGNEIAAGGAPWTGDACLTGGTYNVYGQDAYGDGWNGNMLTVTDDNDGTVYLNWTVDGSAGETTFEIGGSSDVYGCTDPNAANYDPDATIDDGSCVYWGDDCEYPLEAVEGSNDASGADQFFHYTASADGSVTVSSDDGSGVAPDTYLYVLGSCSTDDYGSYDDVLGLNDDCCGYYGPSTVEVNVTAGQDLYLYWYGVYGPGPFVFTVEEGGSVEECVDDSYEDNDGDGIENDSYTTPETISPGSYDLQMCQGDADWYGISVSNGQTLRATLTDVSETGQMDLGLFALEIDPSYALCYVSEQNYLECEYSNELDHPVDFMIAARDYYGQAEGPYTLTVELLDFEQTTYTVYRDDAVIASDLLLLSYVDNDISDNVEYCYTVTANVSGMESPPSNEACETHVYIEPPDAPSNISAEGGWLNVGGVDYPAVTWSWEYELPPPGGTIVTVDIVTDNYPSETTWEIIDDAGNVMNAGGPYTDPATQYLTTTELDDGDYTFIIYDAWGDGICCSYGEGSYTVYLDDGTVIASGGEFGDSEATPFTIGGGRDESSSVFNINDGSSEFENGLRDIVFELCFSYYGTDYCFQTTEMSITIYGFVDGDLVCGWCYAIEDGTYSEASETACANAGGSGTVDVTVDHASGWNMVSIAVGTDANGVGDLFSGFIGGTLYEYPYNAVEALNLGQGYWLRFDSDGSDTQSGEPVDDLGVSLSAGWNLIGSVSADAGIGDPDGVVIGGTLYGYPYSDEVSAIEPGSGYWLRASADGMIYLSTSASLPRTTAELTANSLTINGMKLNFGVDITEDLAMSHSLPPKPFEGAFDVRFAGNTKIAEDAAVIDVMNSSNELTIEYSIVKDAGEHMLWVLATDREEFVLNGMGSVIVSGSVTSMTLNKVAEVPETFGLSQNFPNPFNPVTNISFQVPEASDVTVAVYNMMGQKIADLVQAHVPAGYHQVVWDSRNLQGESVSSGVYLYTITSGNYHAMKKMILMK